MCIFIVYHVYISLALALLGVLIIYICIFIIYHVYISLALALLGVLAPYSLRAACGSSQLLPLPPGELRLCCGPSGAVAAAVAAVAAVLEGVLIRAPAALSSAFACCGGST
jgi:hypothetical protein